jgi:hypothetical protein
MQATKQDKIHATYTRKTYYKAKPVRYERDEEGNKTDHIQQVGNPMDADFWSVYAYIFDGEVGHHRASCIADFTGTEDADDAKMFATLKNNIV